MRNKLFLITAVMFILACSIRGQNMYLSPANIIPGSYIITATAGVCPANPTTNNTSQSIKYKWAFNGEQSGMIGNITVASSSIPSGITVTVIATGDNGSDGWILKDRYGVGNVTIIVSPTPQNLISGIWSTNSSAWWGTVKTVTRPLTQNIKISDFSNLHPGTYPVTLTYIMQ